jgi:peptidoglycan/xylan/chitin deacetylase (PgdA/CDA1 family)
MLKKLLAERCEIALHGYNHDNKFPFLSKEEMKWKLDSLQDSIERYSIKGFRSPSLYRTPLMFDILGEFFGWDSSVPDTELGKGCCSIFPFLKGKLLEIPLTLSMDSSLIFLGKKPEDILDDWKKKADLIYKIGGIITLTTHPERHFSANPKMLDVYNKILHHLTEDKKICFCLPKELFANICEN